MTIEITSTEIDENLEEAKSNRSNGLKEYNLKVRGILDYYYFLLKREELFTLVSMDDRKDYNRSIRSFLKNNKTRQEPLTVDDIKMAMVIAFDNPWYKNNDKLESLLNLSRIFQSKAYLSNAIKSRGKKLPEIATKKKFSVLNHEGKIVSSLFWGYFELNKENVIVHIPGMKTKEVKKEEENRIQLDKKNDEKDKFFTEAGNIRGRFGWMVGMKGGEKQIFVGKEIQ